MLSLLKWYIRYLLTFAWYFQGTQHKESSENYPEIPPPEVTYNLGSLDAERVTENKKGEIKS